MSKHSYSGESFQKALQAAKAPTWKRQSLVSAGGIPRFAYKDVMANESDLHAWLSELDQVGLTLLTGAPIERGIVSQLTHRVAYPRNTMYGMSWDVESIPNPNNVAYTSLQLPLHADLCYYESPPGVQLLHCIKFDQKTGGDNTFVDAFQVAMDLKEKDPDSFRVLAQVPTKFHKDDELHHLHYSHPIIELTPHTQALKAINWSPPFEGVQCIPEQLVAPYYYARRVWSELLNHPDYVMHHRLTPGEVVVFNNRRVLHARDAFDEKAGHRLLEGAYIGSDEWVERLRVLKRKYNPSSVIHDGSGFTL